MTILAVIGLSAAAVVGAERSLRIDELTAEVEQKDSTIAGLEERIDALEQDSDDEIGFTPCWRANSGDRRFFVTYDVTVVSERYILSPHRDFGRGTAVVDSLPPAVLATLRDFPDEPFDAAGLSGFGQSVSDAISDIYPAGCRLVATVNRQVTGDVIAAIYRAGFYPVYR